MVMLMENGYANGKWLCQWKMVMLMENVDALAGTIVVVAQIIISGSKHHWRQISHVVIEIIMAAALITWSCCYHGCVNHVLV